MRFKQFLESSLASHLNSGNTGVVTDEIETEDAIKFVRANSGAQWCLENDEYIWRGMGPKNSGFLLGHDNFDRIAANTANYVNMFVSNAAQWSQWPKRSKSYICSMQEELTGGYGVRYVALPADDAHIGLCERYDFWTSFDLLREMGGLNVDVLCLILSMFNNKLDESNWTILKTQLKNIDLQYMKQFIQDNAELVSICIDQIHHMISYMQEHDAKNVYELLEYVLDPNLNDFQMFKGRQCSSFVRPLRKEAWIQGKVLFIRNTRLATFKNEI